MTNPLTITEDQVAQYQRDGAILLKGVIDADSLRLLEQGLEETHADEGPMRSRVSDADGAGETSVEQFPSLRSPSLRALMDRGVIGEIAGRLMRTASAQLILDQIFYKEKGRIVPTPWHQDTPFLRVRGMDMARVWLTCDPSPKDLTVQVVRGSHRWNVVYNTHSEAEAPNVKSQDSADFTYEGMGEAGLPPAPDVARHRDSFDILSWDVEPGDALIFQGNMLHGTEGRDHYDRPRRAFASMWGGPDLRYHAPRGHAFPPPGDISGRPIPDGARIGDHEALFPVGWRAAS